MQFDNKIIANKSTKNIGTGAKLSFSSPPSGGDKDKSLDQFYMKSKLKELKEDFDRKQKILESDSVRKINLNNINVQSIEANIYRKIINISISLVITGLLMGVLLGLIIVMYFNSK